MAHARPTTAPAFLLASSLVACACVPQAASDTRDARAATAHVPTASPTPDHSAFVGAVEALAQDARARGPIAGLSIAVVARGDQVIAKGYGSADLEHGLPATPETSYPIASVSKLFTAALVLRLVEQGRVGLDDPLSRFFPAARPQIGALTVRHLMDHTSGLTRGGPAPREAALSVIRRGGAAFGQGETWDYSNYNFSLLGLVIEHVTGRDYASNVRDEVAAPHGLGGTGYCEDGTMVAGRGRDYLSGRRNVSPTPYWTRPRFFASGGLCSTVLDLVRWQRALDEGRIVSTATLRAMRTPARLSGAIEADYGLGTRMGWTAGRRKVGHTGGGQGNKAVLARYPDDDVTIAVLLNTERENAPVTATDLEERIGRLYFAGADAAVSLSPASLATSPPGLAGVYREGPRLTSISTEEGALTIRPGLSRQATSRLVAAPGGAFVVEEDPSNELRFDVQDDGARSYARYRNGWFHGVAVRSGEPFPPERPRRKARRSRP